MKIKELKELLNRLDENDEVVLKIHEDQYKGITHTYEAYVVLVNMNIYRKYNQFVDELKDLKRVILLGG